MKRTFFTGTLIVVSLAQSLAHAQLVDLPDPGGDNGGSNQNPVTPSTPVVTPSTPATQYAGSLRLSMISRKNGGALYKIDLAESFRLQRLDLRVAASRVKIHRATLVMESGSRLSVNQLTNTQVLATSTVLNSENFNSNERVKTIEIMAEGYDGDTDIILTALADAGVPKLALRQEAQPQQPIPQQPQTPVIVTPPDFIPDYPVDPYNPDNNGGSIIYYGNKFKTGDVVLLECDQRRPCTNARLWLGTVQVIRNGQVRLKIGSDILTVQENFLSKSVNAIDGFRVQMTVSDGRQQGRVLRLFEEGTAQVEWSNGRNELQHTTNLQPYSAPVYEEPEYNEPNYGQSQECLFERGRATFCLGDAVSYRRMPRLRFTVDSIEGNGRVYIVNRANGYGMSVDAFELTLSRDARVRW